MGTLQQGSNRDREQAKFEADELNKTGITVLQGWTINSAFSLLKDFLNLEGFRYYTQREDSDYSYLEYFNANDDYIGGIKISKTEKKAELFYPNLLVQDFDRLLLENNEGVLI